MNTVTIPAIGTSSTQLGVPAIYRAATIPLRIVVANVGPNLIFLAHSASELQVSPATSGVYRLATGRSETFVLAPRQGLYGVGQGGGGLVSIAVSEGLPVVP